MAGAKDNGRVVVRETVIVRKYADDAAFAAGQPDELHVQVVDSDLHTGAVIESSERVVRPGDPDWDALRPEHERQE